MQYIQGSKWFKLVDLQILYPSRRAKVHESSNQLLL